MRYIENEGRLVTSASDLKAASECEFAWVRAIDARLGRIARVVEPEDLTLERAARLGDRHEQRVLDAISRRQIRMAWPPSSRSRRAMLPALAEAVRLTNTALTDSSVRIIYQAAFATPDFVGFADFLVRDEHDRWLVQDTKLARRARVTALMQLAAYVQRLDDLGVERSDRVELLLGDGTTSSHLVDDILPVYHLRYARLVDLIESRQIELGAVGSRPRGATIGTSRAVDARRARSRSRPRAICCSSRACGRCSARSSGRRAFARSTTSRWRRRRPRT